MFWAWERVNNCSWALIRLIHWAKAHFSTLTNGPQTLGHREIPWTFQKNKIPLPGSNPQTFRFHCCGAHVADQDRLELLRDSSLPQSLEITGLR